MYFLSSILLLLAASAHFAASSKACPFLKSHEANKERRVTFRLLGEGGDGGTIPEGGFTAVQEDIKKVLIDSQEFWPADFGNYGPFMIRLAWHCSGSFRRSDGRGGCDGGRIRFDPEMNWPDNGNLDQALRLLEPIKEKYGSELSWGDLIVLTGTTAIEFMGGPVLGFCGGRIDDADGSLSVPLGPSEEQILLMPCEVNGRCEAPLGPTTIGLIYVNPAGPEGNPDQAGSAVDIRNSLGNMGFNDTETVSLIGGGHAFGKCHGGCDIPPCVGTGADGNPSTVTSGFELQWTSSPTTWTNEYFRNILDFDYNLTTSPAGEPQWQPFNADGTPGPANIYMLTADLALNNDPEYAKLVQLYASDIAALEKDFAASWYRLTSQDMGPDTRCIGDLLPSPQPFQQPLKTSPVIPGQGSFFIRARTAIQKKIDDGSLTKEDLIHLAFQCASTYRSTDYSGGCNGARIRFAPESEWTVNVGLDTVLAELSTINRGPVSMADLIVLAGQTALEATGSAKLAFCGGRVDADNAAFSENLAPRDYVAAPTVAVKDNFNVRGLTASQGVALFGRPSTRYPELGSLFAAMTTQTFEGPDAQGMFAPVGGGSPVTTMEYALTEESEYLAIVESFAEDMDAFKAALASGWTYLMTADRHSGPKTNACTGRDDPTIKSEACFSGDMTVELENKSIVPLRQVQIGDRVKVAHGKYEPIYAFGHKDAEVTNHFLEITTRGNKKPLEISEDHMVSMESGRYVAASMIVLGDTLVSSSGHLIEVTRIRNLNSKGIYAPFTYSGIIHINGIQVSSYVSLQDNAAEFLTIGTFQTPLTHQWVAHSFLLPFRLLKSDAVLNSWMNWLHRSSQWLLKQHPILLGLVMVPLVGVFGAASMVEALWIIQPALVFCAGLLIAFCMKRRRAGDHFPEEKIV